MVVICEYVLISVGVHNNLVLFNYVHGLQEPSVSLVEAKMGRRLEGSVIKCNDPRGINTGSH